MLAKFFQSHPKAEYFIVDGSHKTTAAALCGKRITVMVFQSATDIQEARRLVKKGKIFSLTAGGNSIPEVVRTLRQHFFKTRRFETVAEKTTRLVKEKKVPRYMIGVYKKSSPVFDKPA